MRDTVYFVRRPSDGLIKIGVTCHLPTRLGTLGRKGDLLEVLATTRGCRQLEGRFHALLIDAHVGHEWFRPEERVLAVAAAIRYGFFDFACLPNEPSPMRSASALRTWATRRARTAEAVALSDVAA